MTNPLVTGSRLIATSYIYTNTPSMFNVYTSQIYSQLRSQAHERDIGLHIQDNIPSWMKLIERDDHRLTKAACRLVDQRHDGHLILPWTRGRHLIEAFGSSMKIGSTLMAELIQATKLYYSTVEGFITGNPLLLNLRYMADHMKRECHMYVFSGEGLLHMENEEACGDTLMNGHWEELFGKVEGLLHATDDPDNCHMHI